MVSTTVFPCNSFCGQRLRSWGRPITAQGTLPRTQVIDHFVSVVPPFFKTEVLQTWKLPKPFLTRNNLPSDRKTFVLDDSYSICCLRIETRECVNVIKQSSRILTTVKDLCYLIARRWSIGNSEDESNRVWNAYLFFVLSHVSGTLYFEAIMSK